jgi:hypothetical protein
MKQHSNAANSRFEITTTRCTEGISSLSKAKNADWNVDFFTAHVAFPTYLAHSIQQRNFPSELRMLKNCTFCSPAGWLLLIAFQSNFARQI